MKRPSSFSALTAPMAAPLVSVGRMIEQFGNFLFRNGHGSGMIRFACNVSGAPLCRSLNVTDELFIGSNTVNGGLGPGPGPAFAFPALSCHVWKCAVSVGPMLSTTLKTSGLLTL